MKPYQERTQLREGTGGLASLLTTESHFSSGTSEPATNQRGDLPLNPIPARPLSLGQEIQGKEVESADLNHMGTSLAEARDITAGLANSRASGKSSLLFVLLELGSSWFCTKFVTPLLTWYSSRSSHCIWYLKHCPMPTQPPPASSTTSASKASAAGTVR